MTLTDWASHYYSSGDQIAKLDNPTSLYWPVGTLLSLFLCPPLKKKLVYKRQYCTSYMKVYLPGIAWQPTSSRAWSSGWLSISVHSLITSGHCTNQLLSHTCIEGVYMELWSSIDEWSIRGSRTVRRFATTSGLKTPIYITRNRHNRHLLDRQTIYQRAKYAMNNNTKG